MVEARGIEPLSKNNPTKTSTCLAKMTTSPYFAHLPKLKSKAKTLFHLNVCQTQGYTIKDDRKLS